ncbi:MAG: hypothetical protein GYB25_01275 [Rhodobacteraceae bacterium]|nr:hypothetical protein [Paracoccaceae bacterium]
MRWVLGFCLTLLAGLAEAGIVDIRSGEHDGFTRLVFTFPVTNTAWSLSGSGTEYRIKIETESPEYAAETVFERIPRTRLAEIGARNGHPEVTLHLACPCTVEAFAFGERSVVVDIRSPEQPVRITQPFRKEPETEEEAPPSPTVLRLGSKERKTVSQRWTGIDGFVDESARNRDHRDRLVRAVARAASQGLVVPNVVLPPVISQQSVTEEVTPVPRSHDPAPDLPENLRMETTYDKAFEMVESALPDRSCLPDTLVDIANWEMGGDGQSAQLLDRTALVTEMGAINEKAVLAQARALLYQSFGAEARQILTLVSTSQETVLLLALADIMDSEPLAKADVFLHSDDCVGKVIFWALLAGNMSPTEEQEKAILRTFSALPGHLRRHLGPRVAKAFLALGKTSTADVASAMIERVSEAEDPSTLLVQARIGAKDGQTVRAETALANMVSKGERITPEALINLVDLYAERDFAPTADMVALIEAYALEHRRATLGSDLRKAHAVAAALSGHFEKAFDVSREVVELDGGEAARALRSDVVKRLLDGADDATILKMVLGRSLGLEAPLNREATLAVADALAAMGFPAESRHLLEAVPFHMTEGERLLRARLALAEARPRQAEAELLGIKTEEAQRLRAKARALAGDHARAAVVYEEIGMQEAAAQQTWLAGDWVQLRETGGVVHKRVAQHLVEADPRDDPGDDAEGPLARNRAEVEESAELREHLAALLAQHAMLDF